MEFIVGIDPGLKGAIVVMNVTKHVVPNGAVTELMVMPNNLIKLVDMLEVYNRDGNKIRMVYIEKAQAMPKQGVSSMFKYGMGYGELLGILYALRLPHGLVHPRVWCKTMHAGLSAKASAKERSKEAVKRLFPDVNTLATSRSTKPHEGIIDALLITEFGRRQLAN